MTKSFRKLGPPAQEYARELVRVAGPDRLVWASDCPFVGHEGQFPYRATIDWLVDAIPDATARAPLPGEAAAAKAEPAHTGSLPASLPAITGQKQAGAVK